MQVLVTGATGLIGATLIRRLREEHDVFALSRSSAGIPVDLPVGRRILADFAGTWHAGVLPKKLDAVVHLAQSDDHRDFPDKARTMFSVNVESTMRLLDHAQRSGVRSFLLASTGGLYLPSEKPVREDDPTGCDGPLGFYLRTRRAAEEIALGYAAQFRVLAMRFFFAYGPGQRDSMLFPRLLRSVREGTPIRLEGTEGVRLNPLHVEDAASAIVAALKGDVSGVMNIAGPEVLSMREIGTILAAAAGKAPSFTTVDARPESRVASIERLRGTFEPTILLRDRAKELL